MNCPFAAEKATQVAAAFIQKEGSGLNIMKLIKLVYLLDRLSFDRRGIPVLGGDYFSMRNGPVTSELLDLINSGSLWGMEADWNSFISAREDHIVSVLADPGTSQLSASELALINEVYAQHGMKDQFALRDWCHEHLPEWHGISEGRKGISVEFLLEALDKPSETVREIVAEQKSVSMLDAMLA